VLPSGAPGDTRGVADPRGGLRRPLCHLRPREADNVEAAAAEELVLHRVAAPGRRGAVEVVAVGLDDEAVLGPEEVGRPRPDPDVHLRPRDAVGRAHPEEAQLEHRPDVGRVDRANQDPPQLRITPLPRTCEHLRRQRRRRHLEHDLGLFEGLSEGTEGEHGGEVEQRPDRRRDRDAAVDCDVARGEPLPMHDDPVAFAVSRGRGNDHLRDRRACQHPPERAGGDVAEHRPVSERQHGREPARLARPRYVPDGVDPGVPSDEPALVATLVDLVPRQTARLELRARDIAVLLLRDATNVIWCSHREH
jgi:hypothetical protein